MDAAWAALNARIEACQICALVRNITHKVPGQGNPTARLLLIGEAPGAEEEQTRLIRPGVILLLGATALKTVLGEDKRITRCRGQWVESKGVHILPTFHPSALLRDPGKKKDAWAALQAVRERLAALKTSFHPADDI